MPKSLAAQLKLKTEPRKKRKDANKEVKLGAGYIKPEMVDAEKYLSEPGDWEEENVIYTFTDGWTINECLTPYDVRLVAYLTLTCVASYPVRNPSLTIAQQRKVMLGAEHKRIEKMYEMDSWMTKEQIKERVKRAKAALKASNMRIPPTRIFRLTDTEGRPRAMILTVLDEALNYEGWGGPETKLGPPLQHGGKWHLANYTKSRDFGCQAPFEVSGQLLHLCEARIGTGASIPSVAVPYLQEWYKASIQGEWQQELYDTASRARWAAYNYSQRPQREDA